MRKKILAALLAVCMLASMMFIPASAAGFDDVADDHWAKGAIDRWSDFGVLNGVGEGSFSPDRGMKRSEFAKFIVELMGLPTDDSEVPFDDVMGTNDEWAAPYITAANKAGIINGVGGNRFSPSRDVKFNEGAAMMARAVGLVESSAFGDTVTDKLTELGMLDENVKADMTFDRAGVAGLANNMIGAYVTADNLSETQEGEDGNVITGTVKGVIVVKGGDEGVAVTIKDVNVPAVVAVGGSVELAGATVETVKVTGTNAVVAADKDTTIGTVAIEGDKADVALDGTVKNVTVEGTDASLTVDGEVENVTVAADATVAKIEGSGVSSENVTNNSAEEIKVNEETVAPTPAEPENPDEGDDEQGGSTGVVPDPVTPPAPPTVDESKPEGATQKETTKDDAGAVVAGDGACTNHVWGDKVTASCVAATCTTPGKDVYKCTGKVTTTDEDGNETEVDCTAVKEVTVPALGHKEYLLQADVTAAKCTTAGKAIHRCANGDCDYTREEAIPALGHHQANFPAKAATAEAAGNTAGIYCDRGELCDGTPKETVADSGDVYWLVKAKAISATGGDDGDDGGDGGDETPTAHTCAFTTYTVDSGNATCSATCTLTGTHGTANGKDTKTHTSGEKCTYCNGTYWNVDGTWQDTEPKADPTAP